MAWSGAIQRCRRHLDYRDRGIAVAPEWVHDFPAFLAHVGLAPGPEYSIDRIDNDGHYEPGNVRWATRKEQTANRRRPVARTVLVLKVSDEPKP